jgi:hypothetical protein
VHLGSRSHRVSISRTDSCEKATRRSRIRIGRHLSPGGDAGCITVQYRSRIRPMSSSMQIEDPAAGEKWAAGGRHLGRRVGPLCLFRPLTSFELKASVAIARPRNVSIQALAFILVRSTVTSVGDEPLRSVDVVVSEAISSGLLTRLHLCATASSHDRWRGISAWAMRRVRMLVALAAALPKCLCCNLSC